MACSPTTFTGMSVKTGTAPRPITRAPSAANLLQQQTGSRSRHKRTKSQDDVWTVNVANIDEDLALSPKARADLLLCQCHRVSLDIGIAGTVGFRAVVRKASRKAFQQKVEIKQFNRGPNGEVFPAEGSGLLHVGDVIKFVNGKFVHNIEAFVQLMSAEARAAKELPEGTSYRIELGVLRYTT